MNLDPSNTNIVFVNTLDERYKCISCGNILKEPVQTSCGHRFCLECVNKILKCPKPCCPFDNQELQKDEVFLDRFAAREIAELKCYCPNKNSGCSWTGTVAALSEHACPYEKVQCLEEGCPELVLRCQLPRHVEKECKYRKVQCMYCNKMIPEILMEKHFRTECERFLLECQNGCGEKDIPRDMMDEHINIDCPLEIKFCRFHQFGCDFKDTKEQMDRHMKDALQNHLILAMDSAEKSNFLLQQLERKTIALQENNRLLESYVESQKDALNTSLETLSSQQIKLNTVEKFLQNHKETLDEMTEKIGKQKDDRDTESLKKYVAEFERKISSFSQKIEDFQEDVLFHSLTSSSRSNPSDSRKFDQMEHMLALHEIQIAEHNQRLQLINTASYDGTHVWKIDDYSQRFGEAVTNKTPSIYSSPFYTSRFGYKLCARAYLNGDGTGKGTHLSLFISVMSGEYDAILPWPFNKKVTLILLDQNKVVDVSETFMPDPKSSSFKQPTSTMNVASGCPKFCAHTRLQTHGYVKDNVMFVKIIVG